MKIKIDFIRKYVFALGFILFFIIPGIAFAADAVILMEEIEGTTQVQSTGEEASQLENDSLIDAGGEITTVSRSDEMSLSATRRARLQTINNIIRSQQSIQRITVP